MNSVDNISTIFDVTVYPNPFTETLIVHMNLTEASTVKVAIFDILGRVVDAKEFGIKVGPIDETVKVSTLNEGIYLMRVSAGDQNASIKIIKK